MSAIRSDPRPFRACLYPRLVSVLGWMEQLTLLSLNAILIGTPWGKHPPGPELSLNGGGCARIDATHVYVMPLQGEFLDGF